MTDLNSYLMKSLVAGDIQAQISLIDNFDKVMTENFRSNNDDILY